MASVDETMGEATATGAARTRRRRFIERPSDTPAQTKAKTRIKMLVAPAGYGKTTLARQWLADKQAVWYTATPASADVAALAAGLSEAVSRVVPGAGDALMERLSVTSRPEEEGRGRWRPCSLATCPGGRGDNWLVLDDYHEASRSVAAELLIEHLLKDAPLNALIVSRQRPRWASSKCCTAKFSRLIETRSR